MSETFLAQSGIPLVQEDLNKVVGDIVASYEAKIENIDSFFETTHLILNEFQDPLFDTKKEREVINSQLQDLLAKKEHLRRSDFNWMMQGILSIQVEREKEIRNLLNSFLIEQKQMLNTLKDTLTKIKDALAKGEAVGNGHDRSVLIESQKLMVELLTQQDKRKQEVASKLREFQKEQQEMTKRLLELLSKGRELRIKDLKAMLREFKAQHKERLACQEERRVEVQKRKEEVRGMLVEFKKRRKKSVKSRRVNSVKAIPPIRNL